MTDKPEMVSFCPICNARDINGYTHSCTAPGLRLPNLSACDRCGAMVASTYIHDKWHEGSAR